MTSEMSVPADLMDAANWLRERHPWLDSLVGRVCGSSTGQDAWVDEITRAFNALDEHNRSWKDYRSHHPEPRGFADEDAWDRWAQAGPTLDDPAAQVLGGMSPGEVRLLRLVTTLSSEDRCRAGWRLDDIQFDPRGDAVVRDWVTVVLRQVAR